MNGRPLPPVTEIECARTHLQQCSHVLAVRRRATQYGNTEAHRAVVRVAEFHVLAALSWVWDAQERAGLNAIHIRVGDTVTWRDRHGRIVSRTVAKVVTGGTR